MAKKVLKENNKNAQAKATALKKLKTKVSAKTETVATGEAKQINFDFDYSTVRASSEPNTDNRFVTFYVTDNNTGNDVKCIEHVDHISKELRKALESAEII